jgi:hypothetical protein
VVVLEGGCRGGWGEGERRRRRRRRRRKPGKIKRADKLEVYIDGV